MKRIPTKTILWTQVFAALFAAIMTIICFFTPITTLKASGNVSSLFTKYLTYAAAAKIEAAPENSVAILEEIDGYQESMLAAEETDENGVRKGIDVDLSVSNFVFNVADMITIIGRIIDIERLEDPSNYMSEDSAKEMEEIAKELEASDFSELNEDSLGLAYFFCAFIYGTVESAATESESAEDVGNTILNFILTLAFILVVLIMYTVATVCAIILLIGMIKHIKNPENYYEKSSKRASNLVYTALFATFLGLTASNGGSLGVGGILLIVTAVLVLGIFIAAAYLKKNSPAQLKYLLTTHAVGAISLVGIAIAYIGTTAAALGEWLFSPNATLQIAELVATAALAEDYGKLATLTMTSSIVFMLSLVLNLVLITYMLNVFIHSAMLTETKKVSKQSNPVVTAISTVIIVFLPFVLTKFVIGLDVPSSVVGPLAISWAGAILFAVVQIGKEWAYKKFTNISITEKALLLAGCPDGDTVGGAITCEVAPAPAAEAAPAVEAPAEAPVEEVAASEEPKTEE